MNNIKNIKVNGKMLQLNLNQEFKSGYSGSVYYLCDNKENLAIKIYRTEIKYVDEIQDSWFPSIDDLEYFIKFSDFIYPVLLSNSRVFDEDDHYIGCSSYYVTETKGDTKKIIFDLPRDKFFSDIFSLGDQIPFLSKSGILIDDWSIDNIKFGTITKFPTEERIYCFDDSNYFVCQNDDKLTFNLNYECFDYLALDIIESFYGFSCNKFMELIKHKNNRFDYLERTSRGYNTMKEFLIDYPKRYIK